ncbi:unnamed protein product [Prorocentrum cordatum]|uniref:SET domain-containing protein n=1 Tax=Prorocentrum cordatum TaxID=2364126 RepID=A0ABN9PCY0_9DINO|nr:unnamed protein product [Polarella glacialis]
MADLGERLSELHEVLVRRCQHSAQMGWRDDRGSRVRILGRHIGRISAANRTRGYSSQWGLEVRLDATGCGHGVWLATRQRAPNELVEACPLFSTPCTVEQMSESELLASGAFAVQRAGALHLAMPFGFSCLYRRVDFGMNIEPMLDGSELRWVATSLISEGQELLAPAGWHQLLARPVTVSAPKIIVDARSMPLEKLAPLGSCLRHGASPVHGTGVFCTRSCEEGQILELCPVVRLNGEARHLLRDYAMRFSSGHEPDILLALGLGALFNHSPDPHIDWFHDVDMDTIVFVARRSIIVDEEVFIDYGHSYFVSRGVMPSEREVDCEHCSLGDSIG